MSAGGAYSKGKTQQNYVNGVNQQNRLAYDMSQQAREAERTRQSGFEAQANQSFTDILGGMGRESFDASTDAAAQEFVAANDALPSMLNEQARLPGQTGASSVVTERIAGDAGRQAAESRDRVQRLARVIGTGGTTQGRAADVNDSGNFMSILGGLRRGSLAVGQQEQTIGPAQVTPGSTTFADILSGAGSLMTMGGPGMFSGGGINIGQPGSLFGANSWG